MVIFMKDLLLYTRETVSEDIYSAKLAFSMHLAIRRGDTFEALNHNSGVFFSKAVTNEDGSLTAKTLTAPFAFKTPEGFYILSVRTADHGENDDESKGCVLVAFTKNFIVYEELGLIRLSDDYICSVSGVYCKYCNGYKLTWTTQGGVTNDRIFGSLHDAAQREGNAYDAAETFSISFRNYSFEANAKSTIPDGYNFISDAVWIAPGESRFVPAGSLSSLKGLSLPEGCIPSCVISVDDELADYICKKLITPVNTGISVPKDICVSSADELAGISACVSYSDGSSCSKKLDWDCSGVDFTKPGRYNVSATLRQPHFDFPLATDRADPCIGFWNNKYYYIATNDADGNHTLYIREADTIPGLVTAKEHLLLDSVTYEGIGGLLWAPEFHVVNGRLYIFHACTPGEFFREESHIMALREGGNPVNQDDWSRPKRITLKDGSDICEAGKEITLDMTCFEWEGDYYVVWSQRQFLPKDLGAWLYIAKLNPDDPSRLLTDPVVLSKPEYSWANNHTFVDEGPFALIRGNMLYLTFSSAAVDSTYVVSMLITEKGKDLLNPANWRKTNYPILTARSSEGEYGTGHNAYIEDKDGLIWNTYHARPGVNGPRSTGFRRVHFGFDGEPILDMTEEKDICEEFRSISTTIEVRR